MHQIFLSVGSKFFVAREDVWNFAPNLVHVKPYHFFKHTGDINAPPGLSKQENDDKLGVDFSSEKGKQKNELNFKGKIDKILKKDLESSSSESEEGEEEKPKDAPKEDDKENNEVKNETEESSERAKVEEDEQNVKDDLDISDSDDSNSVKQPTNGNTVTEKDIKTKTPEKTEVDIADPDDYLLYLEDILKTVHKAFYDLYDQSKLDSTKVPAPDLKTVIPYVKRKASATLLHLFSLCLNRQISKI